MRDTLSLKLIDRARMSLIEDGAIPFDLAAEMMEQGLIVPDIERRIRAQEGLD